MYLVPIARRLPAAALLVLIAPLGMAQRTLPRPIPPRFDFDRILYYTDGASNQVSVGRITLSGTSERILADDSLVMPGDRGSMDVVESAGHLYVPALSGVLRMDTNGANQVLVCPETFGAISICVDTLEGRVYYAPGNGAVRLRSCGLDGSDPRDLAVAIDLNPIISVARIHLDAGNRRLYWWDNNIAGFRVAILDASGNVTCLKDLFTTGPARYTDFDPVQGMLYWLPSNGDHIFRVPVPAEPMNPCDPSAPVGTPQAVAELISGVVNINLFSVLFEPGSNSGHVAWLEGNSALRWREVKGNTLGPVIQAGSLSFPSSVRNLELATGPPIILR